MTGTLLRGARFISVQTSKMNLNKTKSHGRLIQCGLKAIGG